MAANKILIVDDNESERFLIHRILVKIGISSEDIEEAIDGEEGYNKIVHGNFIPYIVLLDINMPKMNGLEVLVKVRAEMQTLPPYIIILTTSQQESDLGNAITGGVNAFAVKPNEPSRIKNILDAVKLIFINKAVLSSELKKLFSYINIEENQTI